MKPKPINDYKSLLAGNSRLPLLGYSALVGLGAGLAASLFRLLLTYMEELSLNAYGYIASHAALIPLAFVALAAMGYATGLLLKKFKMIGGSGIPQVKGILTGYFKIGWIGSLLAKFFGGAVSMLAGLSLGREGPSIQIGAAAAQGIGEKLAKTDYEKRILIASGAGAGLSAAFNAPLSGVMFTLEEIYKYISPTVLLTAMIGAVVADAISRLICGSESIFNFTVSGAIPIANFWILIVMGVALGLLGAAYNKTLLAAIKLFQIIKQTTFRPVPAFICAGLFGLLFPSVLCGGHTLIKQIDMTTGLGFLLAAFALKFVFSMISYGSGSPGGIFFPLLVMGAVIGAIFARVSIAWFGLDQSLFANMVILAMAGFFTAIVRAPITGIILLVEMTGSFSHLLQLSVVSVTAYIASALVKSEPIYDSLLHNMLARHTAGLSEQDSTRKITVETVVHHGSQADGKYVRDLALPENCLLVAVIRDHKEYIPHGNTLIQPGDSIAVLTDMANETVVREMLDELTKCE
jgi:H+/Cl- antiporter ClcA